MPRRSVSALVAISAWNPGARRLGRAANRSRDAALAGWLRGQCIVARRCRGGLGAWWEEGWLLSEEPSRTFHLLARWSQLAAQRWDGYGTWIVWRSGGRITATVAGSVAR